MLAVQKEVAMAVDTHLGGNVESVEEHEGIIVQVWVNGEGELHIFAVYFCHAEGWITRKMRLCWRRRLYEPETRHFHG